MCLTRIVPSLIMADATFGIGCCAEAEIFPVNDIGFFDRQHGIRGMLLSLLTTLLRMAAERGINTGVRVPEDNPQSGHVHVYDALQAFMAALPRDRPHFILLDEVCDCIALRMHAAGFVYARRHKRLTRDMVYSQCQNFFSLQDECGGLDLRAIEAMRR
jgi:hypothetical protein